MADTSISNSDLVGVVLAGGRSSRMGRDKSLICYHGVPQREYAFDLLKKFCRQVYLSCRAAYEIPAHLNPVEDRFAFQSPLNGILSVFEHDPSRPLLALAVDMPLVDEALLRDLLVRRDTDCIATCFRDSAGKRPEPLCTVWEPGSYPKLRQFVEAGNISPRLFLEQNNVCLLEAVDAGKLTNINSPDEIGSRKGR